MNLKTVLTQKFWSDHKKLIFSFICLCIISFVFWIFTTFLEQQFKNWIFILMPIAAFSIYVFVKHYHEHQNPVEVTGAILIILLTAMTVYFLWLERHTANEFKKWENYNYYNEIYVEWYADIPERFLIARDNKQWENISWENLNNKERGWIRRYFDLYTQEYYFFENKMIPLEMWTEVIHGKECNGGAVINFREFPILVEGYRQWEKKGSFRHPKKFKKVLEQKLKQCQLI